MSLSIHLVTGASIMRSTNTWSPISRVFSIELDGISNAWSTKVMTNRPVTTTMAMEAMNSGVVSFGFAAFFGGGSCALPGTARARLLLPAKCVLPHLPRQALLHRSQHAVPAQTLGQVGHIVRQTRKSIRRPLAADGWSGPVHRPVNEQGTANHVFRGHKAPVARIVAVVAVIAEDEK